MPKWRRIDVDATSLRCIDVNTTSILRRARWVVCCYVFTCIYHCTIAVMVVSVRCVQTDTVFIISIGYTAVGVPTVVISPPVA